MKHGVRDESDNARPDSSPASSTVTPFNRATPATTGPLSELVANFTNSLAFGDDAAFYLAAADGRILFASPAFYDLANIPQDALWIPAEIVQFIAANRESYAHDQSYSDGAATRYVRGFHYPLFDATGAGEKSLAGISGHYTDTTGHVAALTHISQDLSRKFDQLRASSDFFWESDAQGRLLDLSDRITDILAKPAVLFLGQPLSDVGQFRLRSGEACPPPPEFARHQPFRDVIFVLRSHTGEELPFLLGGVPVFEPGSGAFTGYRGVGSDVTARFRAEDTAKTALADLEQAREALSNRNTQLELEYGRAEQALKAKSEFLATMNHELRTPLNAVLGFSEAMTMEIFGKMNDHYSGYAKDIHSSGKHLLSLINSMLEAASLDNNEVSLNPEPVLLDAAMSQSLAIVHMRADAKQIALSTPSDGSGWILNADPIATTQILVNLLSNAIKFTRPSGNIGIDLERRDNAGTPFAAITVWDDGIGVPEDMHEKIFGKFVRGASAFIYDETQVGLGIGLHISRRLAQLMGGNLTVHSSPGKGSRFTVELPLLSAP